MEKEEALKKACSDLEAKKRKIEDEDKAQQDPSDPESTTSSLTISSSSTRHRPDNNNNVKSNSGDAGNTTTNNISNKKKEKEKVAHDLKNDNGATSSTGSNTDDKEKCQTETSNSTNHKKARLSSHVSSLSSSGSSGDNGCGSGKQDQARGVMLSSVSDITDSNKGGSSSEGNRSGSSQRSTSVECQHGDTDSGEYESAGGGTGTVSSDAAVARGQDNHGHETCHADVVITKNRKRKTNIINDDSEFIDVSTQKKEEASSLETSFQLDYEEVFLRSNVPQILATTSGRIVAWNDFFLKITGLKSEEVERLTFFSLVQPNRLSSLFEIVAAALRSGTAQDPNALNEGTSNGVSEISTTSEIDETVRVANTDTSNDMNAGNDMNADNDQEKQNKSVSKRNWNYSAITLPCISFQPSDQTQPKIVNIKINETAMEGSKEVNDKQDDLLQKSDEPNPLYITVTLMTDDDPRKRCFHCVFTDCSGTNGSLGSITPDLLSMLFTKQHLSKMSKDN